MLHSVVGNELVKRDIESSALKNSHGKAEAEELKALKGRTGFVL
jgi:hypothetical protein